MDSLTQIALGSAVGVAVMGRRTAVWKAALWGAVGGTLPDLDALIDHGNPILNMVRHRAESHALFFLTLAAPLLGWIASRLDRRAAPNWNRAPSGGSDTRSGGTWWHWTLALWLVLITHPLLDTMTVYGTQLLMPFSNHPFGVGSVFIIDPAYTLPLIAGVAAALRLKNDRGLRWNAVALVITTLYLGWSVVAQQQVDRIARASLAAQGVPYQGLLVTPAPFSTVLWRLIATTPDRYFVGYRSLLDEAPTVRWISYPRGAEWIAQHRDNDSVARIAAFSKGFYSLRPVDGRMMLTDLRMGQEGGYVFRFDIGATDAVGATAPEQRGSQPDLKRGLPWLWQRMLGHDLPEPPAS